MSLIRFKSNAGKNKVFCPGCGKPTKIFERIEISTSNDHFDYRTEGIRIRCKECGAQEMERIVIAS